jgi:hypothetical protein
MKPNSHLEEKMKTKNLKLAVALMALLASLNLAAKAEAAPVEETSCAHEELNACEPYLSRMLECSGDESYNAAKLEGCCRALRVAPEIFGGFLACAIREQCENIQERCVDAPEDYALPVKGEENQIDETWSDGNEDSAYAEVDDAMDGCNSGPSAPTGAIWLISSWLGLIVIALRRRMLEKSEK